MKTSSLSLGLTVAALLCVLQHAVPQLQQPLYAQEPVALARHDLARGVVLTDDDIEMKSASGTRTGAAGGVGWITRRVIRAGEELRAPAVAPPELVGRGETVELRRQSGSVQLSIAGTALTGAALGERIQIRISRGWTVEAVVIGPALAALPGESR